MQAALFATATGIAIYATTKVGRPHEEWAVKENWAQKLGGKLHSVDAVRIAAALLAILMLLCAGTFAGVPREKGVLHATARRAYGDGRPRSSGAWDSTPMPI